MNYSRRDFSLLFPALVAAAGVATAQTPALPSKTYAFDDLPVRNNGANKSRAVLEGKTHGGFPVEMHITELAPGLAPHPPHHHAHEEMIMIREGTLEVTISGRARNWGQALWLMWLPMRSTAGATSARLAHSILCLLSVGRMHEPEGTLTRKEQFMTKTASDMTLAVRIGILLSFFVLKPDVTFSRADCAHGG